MPHSVRHTHQAGGVASGGATGHIDLSGVTTPPGGATPRWKAMNVHAQWMGSTALDDAYIGYLTDAGVTAVRTNLEMNEIMPSSKGSFDSTMAGRLDAWVSRCDAAGIEVLMIVTGCAGWANGGGNNQKPPTVIQDWVDYAVLCQQRWPTVHTWEVWNEPCGYWSYNPVDAVGYANILRAAYPAMKAQDPTATILGVSLSGPDQTGWLSTFYGSTPNPKDYFDVFSAHGYYINLAGGTPDTLYWNGTPGSTDQSTIMGKYNASIRPIIVAAGDGAKRMWWTEAGLSTADGTYAQQAARLHDAFVAMKAGTAIPTMDRLYWYQIGDNKLSDTGSQGNYGIINNTSDQNVAVPPANLVPKDAYYTLQGE